MKLVYILIGLFLFGICFYVYTKNNKEEFNCNEFGVLYLTPQEIPYASALADKINGIVYIPETNSMIARTEILNCEDTTQLDKFMFGDK